MARLLAKFLAAMLVVGAAVGLACFGLSTAFHDALLIMSSKNARMIPSRGGPIPLYILAGGIAGYGLATIKSKFIDAVGLLIDAPIAIVSAGAAFAVGYLLSTRVAELPGGITVSVVGFAAAALGVLYGFKVWRDEAR